MNIANLLERAGRSFGSNPALSVGEKTHTTYAEFAVRARAIAGHLRRTFGLSVGDRVAVVMTNRPEIYETLFAIWYAGLVAVLPNAKLHRKEHRYILANSQVRLCFTSPDLWETVSLLKDEIPELIEVICTSDDKYTRLLSKEGIVPQPTAPDDPAWLFYTSGTTGRPKGATLTHRNLLAMTLSYFADIDSISPGDTVLHAAPMSHGSGLYGLPYVAKAANNVIPVSGHFEPTEIFDLISHYPGVGFFAAPTMVTRLLSSSALDSTDTSNLKTIIYGGGAMYVSDLQRALDAFGNKLVQIYGQGESPMTITSLSKAHHADKTNPRYLDRLGSVGIPRTDVEVRVADDQNQPLPPGEVGEVLVQGDVVMASYWRNEEATARTLEGGWLHTGDVGCMDEDGFLTLKDRSKDLIISGGTNIYPREVEEILVRHDAVLEAAVIGRPHPDWGEEVVAFVVAREGKKLVEQDLDLLCLENIARFKRPKAYFLVNSLPKNNYGKVLKTELRDSL